MDDFDKMMWAYRAVFTQTDAGGGAIKVTITFAERTVILYGSIGSDDYAADRNINTILTDATGNTIGRLMFTTPTDNEEMNFPNDTASATVAGTGNSFEKRVTVGVGDKLVIAAYTPAQNETLTIALRALVRTILPTVATTGSGGTVSTATTYSKVI